MKNAILGFAFAGLALVSCQNPSTNNMEAAGAPGTAGACAMGASCDMDVADCDDAGACDLGAADCDAMKTEGCEDMGSCEGGDMKAAGECPMEGKN